MADIARDIQQLEALESDLEKVESLNQKIKEMEKKIEKRKETTYSPSSQHPQYEEECKTKLHHEKGMIWARVDNKFNILRILLSVFTVGVILLLPICSFLQWRSDILELYDNASSFSEEMLESVFLELSFRFIFIVALNIIPAIVLCFLLLVLKAKRTFGKVIGILFIIGCLWLSISLVYEFWHLAKPNTSCILYLISMVVVFAIRIVILAIIDKIVTKLVEPKQAAFDLKSQRELYEARAKDQEFLKDQEKKKETFIKQKNEDVAQYTKELNQYKSTLKSHIASINENNILSSNDKNISAVSFILYQLKTGRADSIKEALHYYDDKRSRDSMRELDRLEREWEREKEQEAARKREEEARREREAQRRRQEEIDRKNDELRKEIRKNLDDLEEMRRKLDK